MIGMNFRLKTNITLSLFIGFAILSSITAITQQTQALENTNSSQHMNLGSPFLVEYYQATTGKPDTTNNSISSSFTGTGLKRYN